MSAPGFIPIGDARALARSRGVPVVLIFAIHPDQEHFTVTTYGATKKLCRHAADLGRQLSAAILDGSVSPAETEPLDLPEAPAILAKEEDGR